MMTAHDSMCGHTHLVWFTPTWFDSHPLGLGRSICCSSSGCSCRFHTCPRSRASSTRATSHTMMMSLMSPTRMTALAGTTHSEPGPQVDFLEGQLEFACRAAGPSLGPWSGGNTPWKNVRQRKPQLAGLLLNRKGEESTEVGVLSVWFMTASFKQTSSVAFAQTATTARICHIAGSSASC